MSPIVVVALVAGSLFTTGTVIKPDMPVAGSALQAAGVGTLVGGAIGAAAGGSGAIASALGTSTTSGTIAGAAAVGGGVFLVTDVVKTVPEQVYINNFNN